MEVSNEEEVQTRIRLDGSDPSRLTRLRDGEWVQIGRLRTRVRVTDEGTPWFDLANNEWTKEDAAIEEANEEEADEDIGHGRR